MITARSTIPPTIGMMIRRLPFGFGLSVLESSPAFRSEAFASGVLPLSSSSDGCSSPLAISRAPRPGEERDISDESVW